MLSADQSERVGRILGRPFTVGDLTVRNRIVMAPMTRAASPGGVPGADLAEYYARRAAHDVGLIVTEGIRFSPAVAEGYESVPRLFGDDALAGWARAAERVHQEDGRIVAQLWHPGTGRTDADPPTSPTAPGPSGLGPDGEPLGRAMDDHDIDTVIAEFAAAVAAAERTGFDGVELNGGHGYLIDSFLWSATNRRDDAWGGPPAARARLAAEIVRAARRAVSPGFPIFLRLSQWKLGHYDARLAECPDELERLVAPVVDAGIDGFHASTRRYWQTEFGQGDLNLAGWLKKLTGKPTITVGSVGLDAEFLAGGAVVERAGTASIDGLLDRLEREEFDLVAVGRALLANPDWASKALQGRLHDTVAFDVSVLESLH